MTQAHQVITIAIFRRKFANTRCYPAIKKIPDSSIESACTRILAILKKIAERDKITMVHLALRYLIWTKAPLGALFDQLSKNPLSKILYKTLNPITKYRLPCAADVLTSAEK